MFSHDIFFICTYACEDRKIHLNIPIFLDLLDIDVVTARYNDYSLLQSLKLFPVFLLFIIPFHAAFLLSLTRFHAFLFFSTDGFMPGEQYPESYNSLGKKAFAAGRLEVTGCPDTI